MRNLSSILLTLTLLACVGAAQTTTPATAPTLRILAPQTGENLSTTFVIVKYELAAPASAASTPTFQVQLDSLPAVQIADTQYTFTGVAPGAHTVTVQVVDANSMPAPGAQNQVQFIVQPQTRSTLTAPGSVGGQETHSTELPNTDSPLPLLSVIGMGVLVGGIASALRTRHRSSSNRVQ